MAVRSGAQETRQHPPGRGVGGLEVSHHPQYGPLQPICSVTVQKTGLKQRFGGSASSGHTQAKPPLPRGGRGVRWGLRDPNLPPKHSLLVNMPMRRRCATRGGEAQNGSLRRLSLGSIWL